MTSTAMLFFTIGAVVLWGGLATTLTIGLKNKD
ncbi:MetS family NSS transporter small subunit [Anaerophilus nitritogenes]|nr:MetS family NSS transporter small subunit [Anaerophilus nitritogenes]